MISIKLQMLVWTGKDDRFKVVKMKNCNEFCPIDDYLKIVEDYIPTDEDIDSILSESNIDVKKLLTTDFVFRPKHSA